jgi:hypothetical protein
MWPFSTARFNNTQMERATVWLMRKALAFLPSFLIISSLVSIEATAVGIASGNGILLLLFMLDACFIDPLSEQ